jgi:hypothetical protein
MLKLVHPTWTKLKGNHTASLHVNSNNHMDGNNNKKNFFFQLVTLSCMCIELVVRQICHLISLSRTCVDSLPFRTITN